MISVAEAEARILSTLPNWGVESLPLLQARGRILADQVLADRPSPPFPRVCMDGIAISEISIQPGMKWNAIGTQAAGKPQQKMGPQGTCLEVMTGAILPIGAELVIPYEDLKAGQESTFLYQPRNSEQVLHKGANVSRTGEDFEQWQSLLNAGTVLSSPELGVLASVGVARPKVLRIPRIAIVSTGDELVGVSELPLAHQIRRSNDIAIASALHSWGFTDTSMHHIVDDPYLLRKSLAQILEDCDIIISSGGVSKGKFDWVHKVLPEIGFQTHFHGVAQKPGKPFWFGSNAKGKIVFALPGNPVATLITLHRLVIPALRLSCRMESQPRRFLSQISASSHSALTFFLPVRRRYDGTGYERVPWNGSGDFAALRNTHGFVEVPAQCLNHTSSFGFYPWNPEATCS